MSWALLSLLGVSFGTAVVFVPGVELYLLGLMAAQPDVSWFAAGLATAFGQVAGKMVHYYAARGVVSLPMVTRRLNSANGRFASWFRSFQDTCRHRPVWSTLVVLLSASVGIPPYMLLVLVAGAGRLPVAVLLPAALIGRTVRFCVLAGAPGVLGLSM